MPVCDSGTAIVKNVRRWPAPSIRAASISEFGKRQEVLAHQEDAERIADMRER